MNARDSDELTAKSSPERSADEERRKRGDDTETRARRDGPLTDFLRRLGQLVQIRF